MELKEKLVSSFLAFENKGVLDLDSNVHAIRTASIQNFERDGFPTKKDEEWKYTSLRPLLKQDYCLFPTTEKPIGFKQVKEFLMNEIESYTLIFIDGVFSSFLSDTTHEDCDVCVLSSALTRPKYKMVVDNYFNTIANENNSLAELNTGFAVEGAFINIPKNTILPKPIQILNFSTGSEKDVLLQPRNLVIVGENSHVQIIERHQSLTENPVLTNSVTEIFANKRAIVDYYKVQNDNQSATLIDNTFVKQMCCRLMKNRQYHFGFYRNPQWLFYAQIFP